MSPLGNYINNLLKLVIWKRVYDRIVKKGINIFSKKGFLTGVKCCQEKAQKNFAR